MSVSMKLSPEATSFYRDLIHRAEEASSLPLNSKQTDAIHAVARLVEPQYAGGLDRTRYIVGSLKKLHLPTEFRTRLELTVLARLLGIPRFKPEEIGRSLEGILRSAQDTEEVAEFEAAASMVGGSATNATFAQAFPKDPVLQNVSVIGALCGVAVNDEIVIADKQTNFTIRFVLGRLTNFLYVDPSGMTHEDTDFLLPDIQAARSMLREACTQDREQIVDTKEARARRELLGSLSARLKSLEEEELRHIERLDKKLISAMGHFAKLRPQTLLRLIQVFGVPS